MRGYQWALLISAGFLWMSVGPFGPSQAADSETWFSAASRVPAVCQIGCRRLDVTQAEVRPNDAQEDSARLNQLLAAHRQNTVFYFPPGTYTVSAPIQQERLDRVLFQGAPGAEIRKAPGFKGEYLLAVRFSRNVGVSNLAFQGLTKERNAYRWGESGLYFGSSNGVVIEENRFTDFGDAALRVTTSPAGPQGVASFNTAVRQNVFENVTQITTTSNHNAYGGSSGYLLENNRFVHLKGSVKFASRTPGARDVVIRNNRILGVPGLATANGLEIVSYNDVMVLNNTITDCGNWGMNLYSNPEPGIVGFDWGDILIQGNRILNCAHGIRVSGQPYKTGYAPRLAAIRIVDNTLQVPDPEPIRLVNDARPAVQVQGNQVSPLRLSGAKP